MFSLYCQLRTTPATETLQHPCAALLIGSRYIHGNDTNRFASAISMSECQKLKQRENSRGEKEHLCQHAVLKLSLTLPQVQSDLDLMQIARRIAMGNG